MEEKSTRTRIVLLNATSEGIAPTLKANYWKMSEANYKKTDGHRAPCVVEVAMPNSNLPSKEFEPINTMPDGTCRTLKATQTNVSAANIMRQGTFGATAVVEVYEQGYTPIQHR